MNETPQQLKQEGTRLRAHQLWEERGCPMLGDASADWFEAQSELRVIIRWKAREKWERNGRPAGRDEEFWLEAEREVLEAVLRTVATTAEESQETLTDAAQTTSTHTPKKTSTRIPKKTPIDDEPEREL